MSRDRPPVKFCPYCGSDRVTTRQAVHRCLSCRCTFFTNFSRWLRKAPTGR